MPEMYPHRTSDSHEHYQAICDAASPVHDERLFDHDVYAWPRVPSVVRYSSPTDGDSQSKGGA